MSNSVKSKFAGLFRGLFRRAEETEHSDPSPDVAERPVTAAAPGNPFAEPASAAPVSRPPSADEIALPVAPIVAHMPMDLRAKLMAVPTAGLKINLPVETVLSQLAFGSVKISFGEFRQMVPGLFANTSAEQDIKMISLPLNEILSRLSPGLLARNSSRRVEVDNDIKGPFGAQGKGVSFTSQPLKATAAPKPVVETAPEPITPAPVRPAPSKTEFFPAPPARMNTPAPTAPATPPTIPFAFTPLPATPPAAPVRPPMAAPLPPAPPAAKNGSNGHPLPPPPAPKAPTPPPPAPVTIKLSVPPTPVPPAPTPTQASAPVAPRPEPVQPTIFAALWDLAEAWPEELKNEILATSLANESVPLPGNFVEAGLKKGRLTMHWKQLRTLAKPSSQPSINDGMEVELPLKVIAPIFFAAKKAPVAPKKKQAVSDEIPNLFFGFPQSAPEAPAAPRPAEQRTADSNFYVWGENGEMPQGDEKSLVKPAAPQTDFTSRQATPKELVARAIALPGIAGVLVALPDGLRVASEVPAELNADTLAAFVPQIFERMNQSAKELRMGALNNISFTVGNVPWRIIRVNAVYVAAFGRAGEALPSAQLASLAGELDRKKIN